MEFAINHKARYDFLDVAKAIGIYLVILGHLVMFNWKTFRFIFAFHMPLFFVIAGFIHGRKQITGFRTFLKKQIIYYLLPLIIVFIMGIIQCFAVPLKGHNINTLFSEDMIVDLYEGHYRFSYFGSSWFLLCMFWAQVYFYGLLKLRKSVKRYIYVFCWIITLALAVFAPDIFFFIPRFHKLPLKLDSALMAVVFMGVGYGLSEIYYYFGLEDSKKVKRKGIGLVLVAVGIPAVYFISCKGNTYVNLCDAIYARPERYISGAVFGSLMIIGLGIVFEEVKILRYIGKNTLIIFLSHDAIYTLIIFCVNCIWKLNLEPLRMNFDWICIGISMVTLVICISIVLLVDLVKKRLKSRDKKTIRY